MIHSSHALQFCCSGSKQPWPESQSKCAHDLWKELTSKLQFSFPFFRRWNHFQIGRPKYSCSRTCFHLRQKHQQTCGEDFTERDFQTRRRSSFRTRGLPHHRCKFLLCSNPFSNGVLIKNHSRSGFLFQFLGFKWLNFDRINIIFLPFRKTRISNHQWDWQHPTKLLTPRIIAKMDLVLFSINLDR